MRAVCLLMPSLSIIHNTIFPKIIVIVPTSYLLGGLLCPERVEKDGRVREWLSDANNNQRMLDMVKMSAEKKGGRTREGVG